MANVLVTGATGFTGKYVVQELASAGHQVTAFVRLGSPRELISGWVSRFEVGDLGDPLSLRKAMEGQDVLVNVASIGFGHAKNIVDAARESGVRRSIYFSTTSLFTTLPASSKATRLKAEEAIQTSGGDWTILRPTMIYGDPGDRNLIRLIRWVDRWGMIPVFGPGTFKLQPVNAADLGRSVAKILDHQATFKQAYNLSGGSVVTYNELVELVAGLLERRVKLIHLPVKLSIAAVGLTRWLPRSFRISREQVLRLNEDKAFSHEEATRDFSYTPMSLGDGLAKEVSMYRALGKYPSRSTETDGKSTGPSASSL